MIELNNGNDDLIPAIEEGADVISDEPIEPIETDEPDEPDEHTRSNEILEVQAENINDNTVKDEQLE